jgi:hypothetical protein
MKITGHIGRCAAKGCKHTARVAADAQRRSGDCPEHGRYLLDPIWGEHTDAKCGARCRNAVGPSCDCSCGGENHGMGHAVEEQEQDPTRVIAEQIAAHSGGTVIDRGEFWEIAA